ncbi:MAG TPA: aminotransferase class I/II-fold pyridoxal phosphate-dependent enzyme, partial [Clostridia bacterium]|nr:aminotransferase class I/II-fold pyridoxal phosphate-dependent enzyme [Clostridia bacterium]
MLEARKNIESLAVYHPGKPIEEVQRELGLKKVIKLASNENPLGPSPKAIEAIKKFAGQVNLYPDGSCYRLKEALAKKLNVTENQLFIGNGSNEIIQIMSLTYLNPGDETIMPIPSFPRYEPLTRLMNGLAHEVPLKDFKMDLPAIAKLINDRTKMIYIC